MNSVADEIRHDIDVDLWSSIRRIDNDVQNVRGMVRLCVYHRISVIENIIAICRESDDIVHA